MNETNLDAGALARQFGVPKPAMEQFIDRFAPSRVPAGLFRAEADVMLFIHIPKTAGVSVGRSLHEAFDSFHGVEWNNISRSFRRGTRQAVYAQTRAPSRQVIMGHFGWPEMQIWRNHEMDMKCGTIFRDPVARAISNYRYNCSAAHPDNEGFRSRFPSLESYVDQLSLDVQMTQAIGYVNSFENALEKFLRYYTFLGVTEQLSASLAHLGRTHGLADLREYRKNVGSADNGDEVSAAIRRKIEDVSHNDAKIHQLISLLYRAGA